MSGINKNFKFLCITTVDQLNRAYEYFKGRENLEFITIGYNTANIIHQLLELRKRGLEKSVFFVYDVQLQIFLEKIKGFLLLSGARESYIVDSNGKEIKVTWVHFILLDAPKFVIEYIISYVLIAYTYIRLLTIGPFSKKPKGLKKSMPEKIVYFRTDHWFGSNKAGGSVGHIAGVANAFYDLGHHIFFISTDKLEMVDESKIPIYRIKPSYAFFNNIIEIPEIAYNLRVNRLADVLFKKEKPSLIYQRYALNNYSGLHFSKKYGIPFVLEYNGSMVWISKNWGSPLKFKRTAELVEMTNLRKADLVVVVSKVMKDELLQRGIDDKKILVNPNGVNPEVFSPRIDGSDIRKKFGLGDKIVVGFIGTFGRWHGIEVLAEAVRPVVKKNDKVHFLFIGDGLMMPRVKEILKRDGVERFVTLTGLIPQDQAPIYLAACDILASPHVPNPDGTPFFGSPTKLFEYMAMGKGIVASDLDQIGEVLKNDHSAIMVKPGDANQLAAGIIRLVEDKELRERLGKQAREDVINNYTWKKNVENVLQALEKLSDERSG